METETNQNNQGEIMNLETVANQNEVSKQVFRALAGKERAIRVTSVTNLYRTIHKAKPSIDEQEILQVFKDLEKANMGKLIIGRRNNHNRFVWNYNLKDVAQLATGKTKVNELKPAPKAKKARRYKTPDIETMPEVKQTVKEIEAKSSTLSQQSGPRFQFDIVLSPSVSAADIKALVELVQSLQNK